MISVSKYSGLEERMNEVEEMLHPKDGGAASNTGRRPTPAPSASPFSERV